MSIVTLRLPPVKRQTEQRPQSCPNCYGETFQRWGRVRKPVRDNRLRSVQVYRYHCCHCGYTFRYYPEGVDGADQGRRWLQEKDWLGGEFLPDLLNEAPVVVSNADDLGGRRRRQKVHVTKRIMVACRVVFLEERTLDDFDALIADHSEEGLVLVGKPCKFHFSPSR